jgi:alpha-mannosidase
MELAAEWNERIRIWMEELKNHIFVKLSDVRFNGFVTKERLSYDEALTHEFVPMPQGTPWGAKWEYGWFQAEFVLPREAEGHRIFLHPEVGGEMLIWVNGKTAGSRDSH